MSEGSPLSVRVLELVSSSLNSTTQHQSPLFLKKRFYSFIFREGKGGRKTSMCGCLSCAPYWRAGPQTQACALTGNPPRDPLVYRPALNPLSYSSQVNPSFIRAQTRLQHAWVWTSAPGQWPRPDPLGSVASPMSYENHLNEFIDGKCLQR